MGLSLDSARELHQILRSLLFKEVGVMCWRAEGLRLGVEEARVLQASANLPAELFTSYTFSPKEEDGVTPTEILVRCNLSLLCESLQSLGTDPKSRVLLNLTIPGPEEEIQLSLQDEGVILTVAIPTEEALVEDMLRFNFNHADILFSFRIHGETMKDILSEAESVGQLLELSVGPVDDDQSQPMSIVVKGHGSSAHFLFAPESGLISDLQSLRPATFSYRIAYLKRTLKVLSLASEAKVLADSNGFLHIQFLISLPDSRNETILDFFCSPEITLQDELDTILEGTD